MGERQLSFEEALLVVQELKKRAEAKSLTLVDDKFPKQAAFLSDKTKRLKAARCTRRAGKTNAVGRGLVEPCLQVDGVATLYIGLTKATCRRVFWEDALKPLIAQYSIPAKLNETRLEAHFPNGSRIYCLGMDVSKDEMRKLLGGKYKRIVIDEAQSFRVNLEKLVYEILKPSLADFLGDLWLTGTPDALTKGLFYEVTRDDDVPRRPDWSVHDWTAFDNPYIAEQWAIEISEMIEANPRVVETPAYQRMYLNRWVIDNDQLVYKYDRTRNWIPELPELKKSEYTYGLAVDLGFNDDTSFVVTAYSDESPNLYLLRPFKKPGLLSDDIDKIIRSYRKDFKIFSIVIDGANKQFVEDLKKRFGLPLKSASKTGKAEYIDLFNSDLITGRTKLVGEECSIIEDEWGSLIWDEKAKDKGKRIEHSACPNHLSDASLYGWREARNYLFQEPKIEPKLTEEEKIDRWIEREERNFKRNKSKAFWE